VGAHHQTLALEGSPGIDMTTNQSLPLRMDGGTKRRSKGIVAGHSRGRPWWIVSEKAAYRFQGLQKKRRREQAG
jgi:hypothetical protein